eukprot:TRINITY_DN12758_c0_g1_i1.p1 TRINITY_DN12758_c0_g1~~TRINITY_DN12758_c0_g1_i1.p1  ORF type:complete len:343 (-),score=70.02 TRINITY_DN12758_c0_g1_i1:94-1074(-)
MTVTVSESPKSALTIRTIVWSGIGAIGLCMALFHTLVAEVAVNMHLKEHVDLLLGDAYRSELYQHLFAGWSVSPVTQNWALMQPLIPLGMVIAYISFIRVGNAYMSTRAPISTRSYTRAYNLFIAVLNGYMSYQFYSAFVQYNYNLFCTPTDDSHVAMSSVLWLFYVSKYIEFLDTVWMVLGKKHQQITYLHVFHHSSVVFVFHNVAYAQASGDGFFIAALNASVHVIMYSYYFLSTTFVGKYLGVFKPLITGVQLGQFFIGLYQGYRVGVFGDDCMSPRWFSYQTLWYLTIMVILFGNFFLQTYVFKKKTERPAATAGTEAKKVQ